MHRFFPAALLTLILLGLNAGPADAYLFGKNKVHYDSFDWQVYHSPHFDLYYYPEEELLASQTALLAEQAYARLALRLDHSPLRRIPLVLYSSHPSFQQTNVTPELLGEGTGGFTDIYRSRVVLPYTGSVPQFRHVVAHELVHVFVLDMLFGGSGPEHALRSFGQFNMPPLWFMEGIAEYLSTGWDAEAQLFLEDAVAGEYLQELQFPFGGFLVYKEGQAAISFLAERYGEGILPELLREMSGIGGLERALKKRTGLNFEELSDEFLRETKESVWSQLAKREHPNENAFRLLDHDKTGHGFHLGPRFSPRGDRIAYFADNAGEINLYLASSLDGKVLRKLVTGHRSSDFESLHAFDSQVTFDPEGDRVAFSVLAGGRDELVILDAASGKEIERFRPGFSSIRGPAWSPDGRHIALSAVERGVTDLQLLDLETKEWLRLSFDLADEQDAVWEDAETLLYARHPELLSGRFTFPGEFSPVDLAVDEFGTHPEIFDAGSGYDIWRRTLSGVASPAAATAGDDRNPLPDGEGGLLFTSTAAGLQELWRLAAGAATPEPVYRPSGGVITPSLSGDGKRLAFSTLNRGGYDIFVLEDLPALIAAASDSTKAPTADAATLVFEPFALPRDSAEVGATPPVVVVKPDSLTGLGGPYRTRFLVDAMGRQVTYDTLYGLYGSTIITFKDVLGDQEILVLVDIFGNISDSNLMLAYTRRTSRLNWSVGAYSFLSYYQTSVGSFGEYFPNSRIALEYRRGTYLSTSYPFSLFTRLDADLNLLYARREYYDGVDVWGNPVNSGLGDDESVEKRVLVQPSLSLVYDDALFDYLGPVKGSRWAINAAYAKSIGGDVETARVIGSADWRRYLLGPGGHSIALRLSGRYSGGTDPVIYYLGGPQNLRGYEYLEFAGTRTFVSSVEWRFPFINYLYLGGPLPLVWGGIGGSFFADFGGAWFDNDFKAFDTAASGVRLGDLKGDFGYGFRMRMGGFLLMWDFAWPTDLKDVGGRQVHFSLGTQF